MVRPLLESGILVLLSSKAQFTFYVYTYTCILSWKPKSGKAPWTPSCVGQKKSKRFKYVLFDRSNFSCALTDQSQSEMPSMEVILIGSLQAQCPAGETMDTGVRVHLLQQPCRLSAPPHGNKQRRTMCPAKSPKLLRNETLRWGESVKPASMVSEDGQNAKIASKHLHH